MKLNLFRLVNLGLVLVFLVAAVGAPAVVRGQVPLEVNDTAPEKGETEPGNDALESSPEAVQALIGDAWNVQAVGHIGGLINAIEIEEGYIYIGEGPQLSILSTANPAAPVVVGRALPLPDMITAIDVAGDYAYVTTYASGLWVMNVSNPANPLIVGAMDTPGYATDVDAFGPYAYVADSDYGGVRIIDIFNPAAPVEIGFYPYSGAKVMMHPDGEYLFVLSSNLGLQVVDVSDPNNPVSVGGAGTSYPADITFVADHAYVTSPAGYPASLWSLNITDPLNLIVDGTVYFPDDTSAGGVGVYGGYAYVADPNGGLHVVNISDPANMQVVGYVDDIPYNPASVAISGPYCYLTTGLGGVRVMSLANRSAPVEVGYHNPTSYTNGIDVVGDTVYIADSYIGFKVVDASNPARPVELGQLDPDGYMPTNVDVQGDYAYVADYGLRVVDISSPANPVEASRVPLSDYVGSWEVAVAGNYAYFNGVNTVIGIADISNPLAPTEVFTSTNVTSGLAVAVTGNTLCVGTSWLMGNDFSCYGLLNPEQPGIGSGLYMSYPNDVAIAGSLAYVANGDTGLTVVDISNLSAITETASCDTPGFAMGVFISGNYAYVADHEQGLMVIDISDPTHPEVVGFYNTASTAVDVVVADGYIYVADNWGGLYILQLAWGTGGYSISGRVSDMEGHPLRDAVVSAGGASTLTDINGNYKLYVSPGTYTVTASKANYTFQYPWYGLIVPPSATGVSFTGYFQEKTPVILVPGMLASMNMPCMFNIVVDNFWCYQEDLWGFFTHKAKEVYYPMIYRLALGGYSESNGYLKIVYYNWMQPISTNIQRLMEKIDEVKAATGASKVDLVGHSMGGLLSTAYVLSDQYLLRNDVEHLITLGSPHQGASTAYPYWEAGYLYDVSDEEWNQSVILDNFITRTFPLGKAQSWRTAVPSIRDLLPSSYYIDEGRDIAGYLYDGTENDELIPEYEMIHRNAYLSSLYAQAYKLFERTEAYAFYGSGIATPARFIIEPREWWEWPSWDDGVPIWARQDEFKTFSGDERVVVSSAKLPCPGETSECLREFQGVSHGGLAGNCTVLSELFNILGIPLYECEAQIMTESTDALLVLSLYGEADFTVTDPLNRSIGPNVSEIPEAEYQSADSYPYKLVLIPAPVAGSYQVDVLGNNDGQYSLSLLNFFTPPTSVITNTETLWDTAQSQILPEVTVSFEFTFTEETSPTTALFAVTPVIQVPVMAGSTVVEGRAQPGVTIEIRDAANDTLLGSGVVGADGFYQVTVAQPLMYWQKIYPAAGEVSGVAVPVLAYRQFVPLIQK